MSARIVHSLEPVTLVGGGEADLDDLRAALSLAPTCVAADGGAALAVAGDVELAAVIGDFDSLAPGVAAQIPQDRQWHVAEQDSTDFDKALRHIAAPVVVAVGFTGARLDHQLAALHTLAFHPDRPCILLGRDEITLLCPPVLSVPCAAGDVVSVFPMGKVSGRSEGLEWPINGLAFDPMAKIGTSNRALGPVTLEMDAPGALVILPRRLLGAVTRALASAPPSARWTARAARYKDQPQS